MNIRNEMREWREAGLGENWFLDPKDYPSETVYKRFSSSRIGYFLHLLGYKLGWHTSMIIDPLGPDRFHRAIRSWLWNLWHVDIWWNLTYRWDNWRHPEERLQRMRFMSACMKASDEGCGDPMPAPDGIPSDRFSGVILGERYLKRVAEIMEEHEQ